MRRFASVVLATALVVSSSARAQSPAPARPGFLPQSDLNKGTSHAEEPRISLDPVFADKLQVIGEALANAHTAEEVVRCSLEEADILTDLAATLPAKDREPVIRQVADCLAGPAAFDAAARTRLLDLEKQLAQESPGSELAAYVTYREIDATEQGIVPAVHRHDRLAAFVASYPESKETPTALVGLATSCERTGNLNEARVWYGKLAKSSDAKLARQGQGALRCLSLEGKVLGLALPLLFTENERNDVVFDLDELRGKVVVVYFWTLAEERGDLDRLTKIVDRHRASGVELLCVNLDAEQRKVRETLRDSKAPGIHVFQRGGLDGIVPQRMGITSVPHIILVGRDGVVVRHRVEASILYDQLKELLGRSIRANAD